MWLLLLNDMRAPKIEMLDAVGRAETKEELVAFLDREKVETYRDGQWAKCYRAGGPLEWKNAPWNFEDGEHFVDIGTKKDWMIKAGADFDMHTMAIAHV